MINNESGARVRWIFSLKEHLLLLYNLCQHAQHLHPHNRRWGTCVEHTCIQYGHIQKDTHLSPHHKFRNTASVSPWDLFVASKVCYFFHPPQLLMISLLLSLLHFFLLSLLLSLFCFSSARIYAFVSFALQEWLLIFKT